MGLAGNEVAWFGLFRVVDGGFVASTIGWVWVFFRVATIRWVWEVMGRQNSVFLLVCLKLAHYMIEVTPSNFHCWRLEVKYLTSTQEGKLLWVHSSM